MIDWLASFTLMLAVCAIGYLIGRSRTKAEYDIEKLKQESRRMEMAHTEKLLDHASEHNPDTHQRTAARAELDGRQRLIIGTVVGRDAISSIEANPDDGPTEERTYEAQRVHEADQRLSDAMEANGVPRSLHLDRFLFIPGPDLSDPAVVAALRADAARVVREEKALRKSWLRDRGRESTEGPVSPERAAWLRSRANTVPPVPDLDHRMKKPSEGNKK